MPHGLREGLAGEGGDHLLYVFPAWAGDPVLGEKLMPVGNVEGAQPENAELESVGVGEPVVVTWKLPAVPTVKPVAPALVMVGA